MFYRTYNDVESQVGLAAASTTGRSRKGPRQGSVSASVKNKNKNKEPEFPFGSSGQGKEREGREGREGEEAGDKQGPSSDRRQAEKRVGERRGGTGTKTESKKWGKVGRKGRRPLLPTPSGP